MENTATGFAQPIIDAGIRVAHDTQAQALFAYLDALEDPLAVRKALKPSTELVLVCRDEGDLQHARSLGARALSVPSFELPRMGQIKMSALIAFTQGVLKGGDVFVFLAGPDAHTIDTVVATRVGQEYELFHTFGQPKLTEHIRRPVFEKVLTLCLELAHEGREGQPVGALFVIGDHSGVLQFCQEGRINPFRGYHERERNILDESIRETVKELAKLDGAFIIKGTGVIISAGTTLVPTIATDAIPKGLGARHTAAAAITAATRCIAISLSQSTGTVRVWRRGTAITELEKSFRIAPSESTPRPAP
jgi:DNA integrity scanning protein DisA with diadenylate cyclase activity